MPTVARGTTAQGKAAASTRAQTRAAREASWTRSETKGVKVKTHPDSIYVDGSDVAHARVVNSSVSATIVANQGAALSCDVEFVPASAYVEAIRERDGARVKLAESDESHMFLTEENARLGGELFEARATIAQLRTAETERPAAESFEPAEFGWYYEDDGEPGMCRAGFATEEQAIDAASREFGWNDPDLRVGPMRTVDPADLVDISDVIDQAECGLNDIVADGAVHSSDGAEQALADWARRYLTVDPRRVCEGRQVFPVKGREA